MKKALLSLITLWIMLATVPAAGQKGPAHKTGATEPPQRDGYYKDLFMDGGCSLNSYPDLPTVQPGQRWR